MADFGNQQFSNGINDEKKKYYLNHVILFSSEVVKPFQNQYEKPNRKFTQTLLQESAVLIDRDITDNDIPIEKRLPHDDNLFYTDSSLNIIAFTSEKFKDFEFLQLQNLHDIHL